MLTSCRGTIPSVGVLIVVFRFTSTSPGHHALRCDWMEPGPPAASPLHAMQAAIARVNPGPRKLRVSRGCHL